MAKKEPLYPHVPKSRSNPREEPIKWFAYQDLGRKKQPIIPTWEQPIYAGRSFYVLIASNIPYLVEVDEAIFLENKTAPEIDIRVPPPGTKFRDITNFLKWPKVTKNDCIIRPMPPREEAEARFRQEVAQYNALRERWRITSPEWLMRMEQSVHPDGTREGTMVYIKSALSKR